MHRLEKQLLAYSNRSKEARDATVLLGLFAWEPTRISVFSAVGKHRKHSNAIRTRAIANGLAGNWWPLHSLKNTIGGPAYRALGAIVPLKYTTISAGSAETAQRLVYWNAPDRTSSDSLMVCPMTGGRMPWSAYFIWSLVLDDFHRDAQLCKLAWDDNFAAADAIVNGLFKPLYFRKESYDMPGTKARNRIAMYLRHPRLFVRGVDRLIPVDVSKYKRGLGVARVLSSAFRKGPPPSVDARWNAAALEFGPRAAADIWAPRWVSENLWDSDKTLTTSAYTQQGSE